LGFVIPERFCWIAFEGVVELSFTKLLDITIVGRIEEVDNLIPDNILENLFHKVVGL
jgi:hypothetical protein